MESFQFVRNALTANGKKSHGCGEAPKTLMQVLRLIDASRMIQ